MQRKKKACDVHHCQQWHNRNSCCSTLLGWTLFHLKNNTYIHIFKKLFMGHKFTNLILILFYQTAFPVVQECNVSVGTLKIWSFSDLLKKKFNCELNVCHSIILGSWKRCSQKLVKTGSGAEPTMFKSCTLLNARYTSIAWNFVLSSYKIQKFDFSNNWSSWVQWAFWTVKQTYKL